MAVFISVIIVLLLIYSVLIGYYDTWWNEMPLFSPKEAGAGSPPVKITVIIPARNEENNIGSCLQSLKDQQWPVELLEIIVVNDHSTDNTATVIKNFPAPNIRLLNLSDYVTDPINSYKKKAIEIAVGESTGELIVTTDADCKAGPLWLANIAAFYRENNATFIAAGVKIETNGSLLSVFQSLDFLTLQGITGASVHKRFHSMCNGANMAYEKKAFYEVGGFKGIDSIASGDDMLLMHKIYLKYPERVFFLKNADTVVSTNAEQSWKAFLNQRIRWASKADKYDDKRIFAVLLLVYFLNLTLLILFISGFADPIWFIYAIVLTAAKFLAEISFMRSIAGYFRMSKLLAWFPFIQPLHILYTVMAGFLGKFGTYKWKGRKVN